MAPVIQARNCRPPDTVLDVLVIGLGTTDQGYGERRDIVTVGDFSYPTLFYLINSDDGLNRDEAASDSTEFGLKFFFIGINHHLGTFIEKKFLDFNESKRSLW